MMKSAAVCIVVLALIGSLCDAQFPSKYPPPPSYPQKPQEPEQQKQPFEPPLTWKYPEAPQPEVKPSVPFELRYPVAAATVAVQCQESYVHVEVKMDMFGTGQIINPTHLTLGDCAPVSEDTTAQVLIYQAALQDCGSVLSMTADSLVYTLTLNYNPKPMGSAPVVRTSQAAVIVECHYPRNQNVSSLGIIPHWVPFSQVKMAEEFLYFTLTLMTDDWLYERPSHQYFLGDLIRIEATVKQYFHIPLRVYIDRCVATVTTDVTSTPSYAFIDNHGCLVDARITGSQSKYMARTTENVLQFQLEAFRFQGATSGVMYITCYLLATSTSQAIDDEHRACSYVGGWKEVSGADAACASCESSNFVVYTIPPVPPGTSTVVGPGATAPAQPPAQPPAAPGKYPPYPAYPSYPSYPTRKVRNAYQPEFPEWEGQVTLGPIPIAEKKN